MLDQREIFKPSPIPNEAWCCLAAPVGRDQVWVYYAQTVCSLADFHAPAALVARSLPLLLLRLQLAQPSRALAINVLRDMGVADS